MSFTHGQSMSMTGLSLAYYAYMRDMPLTIRSALTPYLVGY